MTIFLSNLLQFLVVIPAAILSYIPMKNKIKMEHSKFLALLIPTTILAVAAGTTISCYTNVATNYILLPLLVLLYIVYHKTLNVGVGQSLAIYSLCMTLMSFPACYSIMYDAYIHPTETLDDICIQAPAAQLIISFVFLLAFWPLFAKFGRRLINKLSTLKAWYIIVPLFVAFLIANIFTVPRRYETLYINRIFAIYAFILTFELFIIIFICMIFYFLSTQLLRNAENEKRLQQFEMQESQYLAQQKYMEETARMRHDFRQSVYTMQELSNEGNFDALNEYINRYVALLPSSDVVNYCKNNAVNALLNYYSQIFDEKGIHKTWSIDLPKDIDFFQMDLCCLLGNLLENVVNASKVLPIEKRTHKLSVTIENSASLYIVSSNNFDGNVKRKKGKYLSTHTDGHGMGLSSIEITAEKYNGQAQFKNTRNEFLIDVVLDISSKD